jgi:hypothetical protein
MHGVEGLRMVGRLGVIVPFVLPEALPLVPVPFVDVRGIVVTTPDTCPDGGGDGQESLLTIHQNLVEKSEST